jgi:hypothetical protein
VIGFYGLKDTQSDAKGSAKAFPRRRHFLPDRGIQDGVSKSFINLQVVPGVLNCNCSKTKQPLELNDFGYPLRATTMATLGDRNGNSVAVTLDVPATLWSLIGSFECLGTVGGD